MGLVSSSGTGFASLLSTWPANDCICIRHRGGFFSLQLPSDCQGFINVGVVGLSVGLGVKEHAVIG